MTITKLNHGIIILLEFYPSWLALPRKRRRELAGEFYSIIEKYHEDVKVKFFDADAFGDGTYTDFILCETEDLKKYHFMWEEIRDTYAYSNGYLKIKKVIMGVQNAYQKFEEEVLKMDSE
ncbi:darcynin family protein [Neobacillus sp. PS2-9]|uniref:darcynin family protein n=1 Tax=Neobacillus sp. PS2-9 TaxID=3070676 RepID=UPI0027DFEC6B|nr:darcynin family protein [Neobacillus sp. PS2-9]WML58716.1 darcynin family protein [Neobacillus sp. PS2-9]